MRSENSSVAERVKRFEKNSDCSFQVCGLENITADFRCVRDSHPERPAQEQDESLDGFRYSSVAERVKRFEKNSDCSFQVFGLENITADFRYFRDSHQQRPAQEHDESLDGFRYSSVAERVKRFEKNCDGSVSGVWS